MQKHILKYFILINFYFIIPVMLVSQGNKINPNGYNKFYYGNGQISSEGLMKNGKPDGFWKTYYVNGLKKSEGLRTNFLLDSIWNFYDNKENINKKISYKNGKKNGFYTTYKLVKDSVEKNIIISKELYVNDLKQGVSYYNFDNGNVHLKVNYRDNLKNGNGVEYDKNSVIITIIRYRNDVIVAKERINRYNSKGEKIGIWKDFYETGKLKKESYYKFGKLNGYLKKYSKKGKLISSVRYINGEIYVEKKDNKEKPIVKKTYYKNGKLKSEGAYLKNKPVGVHRKFSEIGKVISSKKYTSTGWVAAEGIVDKKGKRQGSWTYFYKNGTVKSTGSYKSSRRVGNWNFYHSNGSLEQKGAYNSKGKIDGEWIWFYENGNILRKENFKNGKEEGLFVEYDIDSLVISKGLYNNGSKEGEWIYHIGDDIQEGNYKEGKKIGTWKYYYPNKKIRVVGNYLDDDETGKFQYYYLNGKLKMEGKYSAGQKHGIWKYYNEEGTLRTTIEYKFDEEIKIDGKKILKKQ